MSRYAVGVDIGGTRTKMGLVELRLGKVFPVKVFDTCRESEEIFLDSMRKALKQCLQEENVKEDELAGVGVSIGSYVFSDGTIDGMSCFVPFMTEGYPLRQRLETAFSLPVRADNDVRLIGLAESLYGAGRGYRRTLTMTLGSGIGIGVCVDGAPLGNEAFCHLAGHVKVRVENFRRLIKNLVTAASKGVWNLPAPGPLLRNISGSAMDQTWTTKNFFNWR